MFSRIMSENKYCSNPRHAGAPCFPCKGSCGKCFRLKTINTYPNGRCSSCADELTHYSPSSSTGKIINAYGAQTVYWKMDEKEDEDEDSGEDEDSEEEDEDEDDEEEEYSEEDEEEDEDDSEEEESGEEYSEKDRKEYEKALRTAKSKFS